MSRVKNLHDLFIVTVGIRLRVDDIYSFNNIYAPTPFECINRHFAKMGYTQPFKKRLKFFLYDKNIALYFYSCLKLVKRKKYDIEDGSRNESKN